MGRFDSRSVRSRVGQRRSSRARRSAARPGRGSGPDRCRLRFEPLEDRCLLSAAAGLELFSLSPALFVENQGQWADESVAFVHQGDGVNVAMTDSGVWFQMFRAGDGPDLSGDCPDFCEAEMGLSPSDATDDVSALTPDPSPNGGGEDVAAANTPLEMLQFSASFVGANPVAPTGLDQAETVFNYCIGPQEDWRTDVPSYEIVAYQDLYDGVDLQTWGLRSHLKYEFHVAPGADYRPIQIHYDGIAGLSLGDDGSLIVDLGNDWGTLIDDAPYIYQIIDGEQVEVAGRFVLIDSQTYTFEVTGSYDPSRELVIDPALAWSTYLGGSGNDYGEGIAVDGSGGVYVTGNTYSSGWVSGGFETSLGGNQDAFVVKLSDTGDHVWSTYLGGNSGDYGEGIAVDGSGGVYVVGSTISSGWTSGGFDTSFGGGRDAFVAKLSGSGGHVWSTYLGEGSYDSGYGIAVDGSGSVYVTGYVTSSGWPSGGLETSTNVDNDAFVVKLSNSGGHVWSRLLGGTGSDEGHGIAVDGAGDVYVTGFTNTPGWTSGGFDTSHGGSSDVFVAKLSGSGSTYLGGSSSDHGYGIAVDGADGVYVTGSTLSSGWTSGGFDTSFNGEPGDSGMADRGDAFVAKLSASGGHVWSTYLGSTNHDFGRGIAVDGTGGVYVTGGTYASDWTSGGFVTSYNGRGAFVAKLSGSGGHAWSNCLGGSNVDSGNGIALDGAGGVCVTGETWSSGWTGGGFDTTFNGGTEDAFVARILINESLLLSGSTIEENQPAGTTIGLLSTTDPDAGNMFTYTLVSGTGSTDNAQFTIDGDTLKSAASFDYEAKSSYQIRVRSTSDTGWSTERELTISVLDVDDYRFSNHVVPQDPPAGTVVGTFSTPDPPGSSYVYALVPGAGDDDNAHFAIDGDALTTIADYDYAARVTYTVRVRSTTDGGAFTEKAFAVVVMDVPGIALADDVVPENEPGAPPSEPCSRSVCRATATRIAWSAGRTAPTTACSPSTATRSARPLRSTTRPRTVASSASVRRTRVGCTSRTRSSSASTPPRPPR